MILACIVNLWPPCARLVADTKQNINQITISCKRQPLIGNRLARRFLITVDGKLKSILSVFIMSTHRMPLSARVQTRLSCNVLDGHAGPRVICVCPSVMIFEWLFRRDSDEHARPNVICACVPAKIINVDATMCGSSRRVCPSVLCACPTTICVRPNHIICGCFGWARVPKRDLRLSFCNNK